jgi:hypothetical protein
MSDDLLQLIFAAVLILFGMLGSRKKKPTDQGPRRRPPQTSSPPRPQPPQPRPQPAPQSHKDALVQELERLLGTRVEVDEAGDLPEAVSLEATDVEDRRVRLDQESTRWAAGLAREEASAETLEEAGTTSHDRFHARYMSASAVEARSAPADPAVARLRSAIIWSEILGPPLSERRS